MTNKYSHLGTVHTAHTTISPTPDPATAQRIIFLLAGSVALMMTGFGIIMPVFARRLGEFGDGVEALGLMTMSYALVQFILSPFMGGLADRYGRRPFILVALAAFVATNIGYLLAETTTQFILIRTLGSAFMAGLFPAAMGVVADIIPERQRAQWIGIVMGGYGAGFVLGPVMGGLLYDAFGFAAPFTTSAALAALAFTAAAYVIPETRPPAVRQRAQLQQNRSFTLTPPPASLWQAIPRPIPLFLTLLFIDFAGTFAFSFIEPEMVFYVYETLGWSTTRFGLVVGVYGLAMVIGQTMLGRVSDRYGRQRVIALGLLLNSTLYFGITYSTSFEFILVVCLIAGLGAALIAPALSAFFLDITAESQRSTVVGIKESALSLGSVLGPLAVAAASGRLAPTTIFMLGGTLLLLALLGALLFLRHSATQKRSVTDDITTQLAEQRCLTAQNSLNGILITAHQARRPTTPASGKL
ncbi:MAG TPA: MFS transporter [Anaerolineae bacterium]|nr:MFS transporter [Anaerolineae bacterium]